MKTDGQQGYSLIGDIAENTRSLAFRENNCVNGIAFEIKIHTRNHCNRNRGKFNPNLLILDL